MKNSTSGYTLTEIMITLVVMGVLSALVTPSLFALLTRQQLNSAQANALNVIRQAQSTAKQSSQKVQACFRTSSTNGVEYQVQTVAQPEVAANNCMGAWQTLVTGGTNIQVDATNSSMTLRNSYRSIRFQDDGWVDGSMGRITFIPKTRTMPRRCVWVSTLIGTMRTAGDDGSSDANCT
ncbi:hypothetical protein DO97_04465 [Neosynechococcus sphagnicola sy1]|uniref:Prepilin-type N-terminal cleavage/methylation domain-containing protein n=1 Tax=Neosynechococcus sphagnicola sy1 TaxID=1497020 RepID=A0A098TKT5_9CYAN|nr:prepilin-type N-terminal cleavage/methylation domain-containing protein [Neosynechococcus sphagnicola]KGF72945.1 hypothetical protein DO97_04465 [Neosynechococcus sphagnicola sy1]